MTQCVRDKKWGNRLEWAQRQILLRVMSAYRTVSTRVLPIRVMVKERKAVFGAGRGFQSERRKIACVKSLGK